MSATPKRQVNRMANNCVLDASAVLAYLNDEPGAEHVGTALDNNTCLLSAVNYIEVVSRLLDHGMPAADAASVVASLELNIVALDFALAQRSAELRLGTRSAGLSLGDRACLALAEREACAAVTADRPWVPLAEHLGIRVECIRPTLS